MGDLGHESKTAEAVSAASHDPVTCAYVPHS